MATRTIVCVRSQYVLEPSPELRPVVSRWTALPAYRASLMIVLALALLFTACRSRAETTAGAGADGGAAAPPQPLRVRLASTALSGAQLPVWTAQETGLFTQHGLDLDLSYIATGQTAMGALLSKEVDALSGGPEASLAVAVEGGDAVVVGASLNKIVQALMVAPAIREPADLRGRTVGVTRFASLSGSSTQYLLRQWGLNPERDVALIQTGGHPETLSAMAAAGIDGGMIPPPLTLRARELGFHELGNLWSQPLQYPGNVLGIRRPTQPEQEEVARRLVSALTEATHRVLVDRALAAAVLAKYTQTDDPVLNEEAVAVYAPLLERDLRPSRDALRTALDELAITNPRAAEVSPDSIMDLRFVDEVERSGLVERLYGS